jgi:hypothetical protein
MAAWNIATSTADGSRIPLNKSSNERGTKSMFFVAALGRQDAAAKRCR